MVRSFAAAFTVFALSASLTTSAAADPSPASLEAVLVASAQTPAEHRALAAHYRRQAELERERAARLRRAARHLGAGKLFQANAARAQRLSQAKRLEASANEHEQLASRHDAHAS
jgi:hypothetical protein